MSQSSIDFERVRHFLQEEALPFWGTSGLYSNGCFVEHLDMSAKPIDPGFSRVRVQARQLYVFSHATLSGLWSGTAALERAANFFMTSAWRGSESGWAKLIDSRGNLLDGSYDLYDTAFSLFSLGWYYKVSRDSRCVEIARQTLDFIERSFSHPHGGYANDATHSHPRQQNPHMHLVEALNIWIAETGEECFSSCAEKILRLVETKFVDIESGALLEFFEDDWKPANDKNGLIVEPGHQFEWAWIIGHNGRITGTVRHDLMRRLYSFASRHGFDEGTALTIDQVDRLGEPIVLGHRLWPQTESLKASLAMSEFLNETDSLRIARVVEAIFEKFLSPAPVRGTWIDHFDATGQPIVQKIPTSSLYHIAMAFQELLRLKSHLMESRENLS